MKDDVRLRPLMPTGEPQLFSSLAVDDARDVVLRPTGTDPQAFSPPLFFAAGTGGSSPPENPGDPPTEGPGGSLVYRIPSGLSSRQKKALAALLACAPCCPGGSGSGSGGGGVLPCCDGATGTQISWEILGASGGAACLTGTAPLDGSLPVCDDPPLVGDGNIICNPIGCQIEADDMSGLLTPTCSDAGDALISPLVTIRAYCVEGETITDFKLSICCIEPIEGGPVYAPRYRMGAYLVVGGLAASWCTDFFDVASCDPLAIEIDNLPAYFSTFPGSPPKLSVVLT